MTANLQRSQSYGLAPMFSDATVFDTMHAGVVSCPRSATLAQAAHVMFTHGVHAVVVENLVAAGRPWRLMSALDVARAAAGPGPGTAIGDVASEEAVPVAPDAPLSTASTLMAEHGVSHLVVIHGGRPIGIVSTADVVRVVARSATESPADVP